MSKLSELVAARVMGAPVIDTLDPVPKGFYVRNRAAYYGDDSDKRCCYFRPDTNFADTAQVLQHMRNEGWGYSIVEPWHGTCRVMFTRRPSHAEVGVSEVQIGDADAPLGELKQAITIAALRACGVPDAEIEEARKG